MLEQEIPTDLFSLQHKLEQPERCLCPGSRDKGLTHGSLRSEKFLAFLLCLWLLQDTYFSQQIWFFSRPWILQVASLGTLGSRSIRFSESLFFFFFVISMGMINFTWLWMSNVRVDWSLAILYCGIIKLPGYNKNSSTIMICIICHVRKQDLSLSPFLCKENCKQVFLLLSVWWEC